MRTDDGRVVGWITDAGNGKLILEYSQEWNLNGRRLDPAIPLGFCGFLSDWQIDGLRERLPSRRNLRYREFCHAWGIDKNENDLIILLATLGHKSVNPVRFYPLNFKPGVWEER